MTDAVLLTLLLVCAILGAVALAGGHLFYNMFEKRLRGIDDTILAHQTAVEDVKDLLREQGKRATAATIDRRREGLVPIHGMKICCKTVTLKPGEGDLTIGPIRANFFRVDAMRILAHAEGDPCIEQRIQIKSVEVNQAPMFDFCSSGRDPVHAVWNDVFATPAGFAVKVDLPVITMESLIEPLFFIFHNGNPNNVCVTVELFGEHLETKPPLGERPWQARAIP